MIRAIFTVLLCYSIIPQVLAEDPPQEVPTYEPADDPTEPADPATEAAALPEEESVDPTPEPEPPTQPLRPTPTPIPPPAPSIEVGQTKEEVLNLLGKPSGDMSSGKGWELLLYPDGEVELKNEVVIKVSFRSPIETQQRIEARQARQASRKQAEQNAHIEAKNRAQARKEKKAKRDKVKAEEEEAWQERMTERVGPKPKISTGKIRRLQRSKRWYWNADGSINWDLVRANPPKEPKPAP